MPARVDDCLFSLSDVILMIITMIMMMMRIMILYCNPNQRKLSPDALLLGKGIIKIISKLQRKMKISNHRRLDP